MNSPRKQAPRKANVGAFDICFTRSPREGESYRFSELKQHGLVTIGDLVEEFGVFGPTELMITFQDWQQSRDPVDALQIMWLCEAMKIYPPNSVLTWFADAADVYLKGEGKPSLDSLLGLVGKAKGQRPRILERKRSKRKSSAVFSAYLLMRNENISAMEAARRIAPEHGYKPETIAIALNSAKKEYDQSDTHHKATGRRIHLAK